MILFPTLSPDRRGITRCHQSVKRESLRPGPCGSGSLRGTSRYAFFLGLHSVDRESVVIASLRSQSAAAAARTGGIRVEEPAIAITKHGDDRCCSTFSGRSGVPFRTWWDNESVMRARTGTGAEQARGHRGARVTDWQLRARFPDARRPKRNGCILHGHCQERAEPLHCGEDAICRGSSAAWWRD